MAWTFANETTLDELELTETRRKQLAILDRLYFDSVADQSILELALADAEDDPDEWVPSTSRWELRDGATVAYEVYMYGGDSGTVFRAGTTEVVAAIVQTGLEPHEDEVEEAVEAAYRAGDFSRAINFTLSM